MDLIPESDEKQSGRKTPATETGNEPPSRREYGSAAGELTDSHTVRSAENL